MTKAVTYFTGRPCKRGHVVERYKATRGCVACQKVVMSEWYKSNREDLLESNRNWKLSNKERVASTAAVWRAEHREQCRSYSLRNRRKNPDGSRVSVRLWAKKNKPKRKAYRAARQLRCRLATPRNVTSSELAVVYLQCPKGYQVDHIIPLNGKLVCGLHTPLNLQYLRAMDNVAKSNHFDPAEHVFEQGRFIYRSQTA